MAGVELLLACLAAREFRQKPILTLVVAPFLLAFAFGGCIEANCLFDRSAPRAFQLRVLDKRISTSRHSSTCYLRVPPWGPRGTDNDLTVGRRLYGSLQAGDPITLRLRKGFLGAAWYTVGRAAP